MADQTASQGDAHLVAKYTEGGHELDMMESGRMMGLLVVLTILIVLSGIGISQFFQAQADKVLTEQAAVPSQRLLDVQAVAEQAAAPIAKGKAALVANPAMLKAGPPPSGWVHPDDQPK